ncbi:MAG: biopolymer transporter ExbD [Bacteroidetes bacterium]|nr:biopolymer transporter ExbD [Bacteroidota bacterium]
MAELNTDSGKKGGKGHSKKLSTRVDLTPMVDLGFLLITFFMLTITLSKPQTMEISMPDNKDPGKDQPKVKASKAMTIILGENDKVYYYFGTREKGIDPKIEVTDFSPEGIRKAILLRNDSAFKAIKVIKKDKDAGIINDSVYKKRVSLVKSAKNGPVVLLKATDKSTYKNLVDILDEMNICNVGKFAIVDITPLDLEFIKPMVK